MYTKSALCNKLSDIKVGCKIEGHCTMYLIPAKNLYGSINFPFFPNVCNNHLFCTIVIWIQVTFFQT